MSEHKESSTRARIARLKQSEKIRSKVKLFREKASLESLDDFGADTPESIWYYFRQAIDETHIHYMNNAANILRMFNDVRNMVIELERRGDANLERNYELDCQAAATKYDKDTSQPTGGNPERAQFVWHMILWFLPESNRWAERAETNIENWAEKIGRLKFDKAMEAKLGKELPKDNMEEGLAYKSLPEKVQALLKNQNADQNYYNRLREAIMEMRASASKKSDLYLIELVLSKCGYINTGAEHTLFIEALEAWKSETDDNAIIKPEWATNRNLTVLKTKISKELYKLLGTRDENYDNWQRKAKEKGVELKKPVVNNLKKLQELEKILNDKMKTLRA